MSSSEQARRRRWRCLAVSLSAAFAASLSAQEDAVEEQLDLEALMKMKVTSVSRKPEPWFDVPSALWVFTAEDIRRSGAVTIPDALRYVPGLHVARSDGNSYAISARGFSSFYGNKLQVLMDGRSLYTPLFSGVYWEVQDTLVEDIDRIEVIRGPGATQWGANAVNGVINIITKNARDTQGTLIEGGGGNEEVGFGGVRYGDKIGESTYWRAYAKYRYRDDQRLSTGQGAQDFSSHYQAGFRSDSLFREVHELTLQGDVYWNEFGVLNNSDAEHKGGNVLGRWTRRFSEESDLQVQLLYDHYERDVPTEYIEERDSFDLDFQHRFQIGERNDFIWGSNYRLSADETGGVAAWRFDPMNRTIQMINGFVRDEIAIIPDHLKLTLGSKFEHNDFTGFEFQPSGRLSWIPDRKHMFWGAVSRAVRTPTRAETDVRLRVGPSGPLVILGNEDFRSEDLIAYEIGYRTRPWRRLSIDLNGYYNVYDDLRTIESIGATGGAPFRLGNEREGNTYGFETVIRYDPFHWWELTASYGLLRQDLEFKEVSTDPTGGTIEVNDPRHIATFRSSLTLPHRIELDQMVRFVDDLPNPFLPGYTELDLRIGWRPLPGLEVSIVGTSLLDRSHPEFPGGMTQPEVERSIYGKVMWLF